MLAWWILGVLALSIVVVTGVYRLAIVTGVDQQAENEADTVWFERLHEINEEVKVIHRTGEFPSLLAPYKDAEYPPDQGYLDLDEVKEIMGRHRADGEDRTLATEIIERERALERRRHIEEGTAAHLRVREDGAGGTERGRARDTDAG